jgi:hypothetical protein
MVTPWKESRPRERVRLVESKLAHTADDHAQAEVTLEWRAVEYRGKATAVGHGAIDLRVCAEAAIDALQQLLSGRMNFRLIGSKSVKAFDDSVAIVALGVHDSETGETRRLIGTALAPEGDIPQGTARAVLNATNRVLGNFLAIGE